MYPWMPAYMGNNNQMLNLISQLNCSQQKLNELQIQNAINSINYCSSQNVVNQQKKIFFHGKEITEDFLSQQEKEIENLKVQLNDIIEQEDEKQKILKIISPSILDKNIKADVVIVYGQISGNIDAENVVCMKGDILGDIKADTVFVPPRVKDAQADYRSTHPNCRHCKFCKVIESPSWSHFPNVYKCDVNKKNLKKWNRIRARLCKYYEPKL